jgi:MFS-type transporter involved in bile tolerance (Atg22 family)
MSKLASNFTISQVISQAFHVIIVLAISTALNLDDVATAHISQGLVSFFLAVGLGLAWFKYLPKVEAKRALPEGKSLFTASLAQSCTTIRLINNEYKRSLRLYFLAVLFAESGATAFFPISLTYMSDVVKMDSTETGIAFLLVLFGGGAGAKFSEYVATRTNMKNSWRINLLFTSVITTIGMFLLNTATITYVFAALWGFGFGWHYAVQTALFSVLMPQEQATEMSGLFSFCSIGFTWFPPLIATIMNENGIHMRYGALHLVAYFLVAVLCLSAMPSFEECLTESHLHSKRTSEARAPEVQTKEETAL